MEYFRNKRLRSIKLSTVVRIKLDHLSKVCCFALSVSICLIDYLKNDCVNACTSLRGQPSCTNIVLRSTFLTRHRQRASKHFHCNSETNWRRWLGSDGKNLIFDSSSLILLNGFFNLCWWTVAADLVYSELHCGSVITVNTLETVLQTL